MNGLRTRFLPASRNALLVELPDLARTLDLLAALQAAPLAGVEELIPAARTIFISFDPYQTSALVLRRAIEGLRIETRLSGSGPLIEIPVRYDGEDLPEVAALLGVSVPEVIRRHTSRDYTVAFNGFAPGFAYLTGGDETLQVPRRATPRTKVPAGSVAVAGTFSAVYPDETPGGWQLLGTATICMWDLQRDPPALLQPGMRVRFVDVATQEAQNSASGVRHIRTVNPDQSPHSAEAPTVPALSVSATGLQTLFQDGGRLGQVAQGVAASGALDQGAMRRANQLVGNASGLPVLEALLGGLQLASHGEPVVAVTGATGLLTITAADGRRWHVPRNQPVALTEGDVLSIGEPATGLRSYVAVRGGFVVKPVLGSASTNTLAKVGPVALAVGQRLPIGPIPGIAVAAPDTAPPALPKAGDTVTLDVMMGPRTDWFTPDAVALLSAQRWQVTLQSDRVGLRLAGDVALARAITQELPSEGAALGAIQVPASGQPVLFLADHPLTAGYPVIGSVMPHHLDLAGQLQPGTWIRFNPLDSFAEIEAL
ncbi:carboxyltransferase domain-containing protein [Ottowia sp. VDI28]|uniref:5-oxoprolinase subunit B/C family protein n=1 Tax=Ottowia sp. VDI28 TaxID=3133968 RepID=UPI003C2AFAF7